MADLKFLAAVKRIDAAVIYEYLMTILEGEPGEVSSLSYERLANRLNEAGLTTGRDAPFSAPDDRQRRPTLRPDRQTLRGADERA